MQAYQLSVDIDMGFIIYCAEVEEDFLSVPCGRDIDAALIPNAVDEVGVLNAGERTFGAERYENLSVESLLVLPVLFLSSLQQEHMRLYQSVLPGYRLQAV